MAAVGADSALSRRIVRSFVQFLSSVEVPPGVDTEGLEVAAQCLSEVFKLHQPQDGDDSSSLPSLLDLFTINQSDLLSLPDRSIRARTDAATEPMSVSPSGSPFMPSTSDANQSASKHVNVRTEGEYTTAGTPSSSADELFEQFKDGLDLSGYFDGLTKDSPEYSNRVKQAKIAFEDSLKRWEGNTFGSSDLEDAQVLAEAFKVQGRQHTQKLAKFEEAIADCEKAIEIDPDYSKAYSRLGWVYHAQGRFKEAIDKGFQKALELDPNNITAKENVLAAQQKLMEQQQQQRQDPNRPGQGAIPAFGGQLPGHMQLPPEMANLIPGIMNLAAQLGQRQQAENFPQGAATGVNQDNGVDHENLDENIQVDGTINITINGEEVPPQFAGLMQSVFSMFGAPQPQPQAQPPYSNRPAPGPGHNPEQGPPAGLGDN